LEKSKRWLQELKDCNSNRKSRFIDGFIQTINVVLRLSERLTEEGIPFLSTRNICQDPLELFFGKVRQQQKVPTCQDFSSIYGKLAAASLVREPTNGNCEATKMTETVEFLCSVSNYFFAV